MSFEDKSLADKPPVDTITACSMRARCFVTRNNVFQRHVAKDSQLFRKDATWAPTTSGWPPKTSSRCTRRSRWMASRNHWQTTLADRCQSGHHGNACNHRTMALSMMC